LIDSLNILNQKGFTNFNLQILGDGIDKESLEEKVKKLNLRDKIKFEGWKNNNEKLKSYNENDVIFITSKQTKTIMEGGPLTLIEAMSQKKICICSDSVGYSEHIIDGENGILFNSGDAESLYQSIKKYLNLNDYERSKMKQKAFETSLRFKRENITEELYNYFFSH
jgi:glycosyltransferase involved in cell wall biosynthesis